MKHHNTECVSRETLGVPTKNDADKAQLENINPYFIEGISRVLTNGERKYGYKNWSGLQLSRLISATKRHLHEFEKACDYDGDSGEHHLAHIAANAQIMYSILSEGLEVTQDDRRWKKRISKDL